MARQLGVRSLTAADKERLAAQDRVAVYDFTVKRHEGEAAEVELMPYQDVLALKVLMRELFEELLDHLPEARDEVLRGIMLSEHPELRPFTLRYSAHAQTATSRFIPHITFGYSLELIEKCVQLHHTFGDDEVGFKDALGKYMVSRGNNLYYSSRSFGQLMGDTELPVEAPSAEELATLEARRKAGERPGAGLLDADPDEMKIKQRDHMIAEHDKELARLYPDSQPAVISEKELPAEAAVALGAATT